MVVLPTPLQDPAPLLARTYAQWQQQGGDLWIFGYASLMWRPDFDCIEQRPALLHGWHRALKMWSHVNRGTPECPGLVFCLLSGGSCRGMTLRVAQAQVPQVLPALWQREMPLAVYEARWLPCQTAQGTVTALAFTLSRQSPFYTGVLSDAQYRQIFAQARGSYGTTLDYARATYDELQRLGIQDRALGRLMLL